MRPNFYLSCVAASVIGLLQACSTPQKATENGETATTVVDTSAVSAATAEAAACVGSTALPAPLTGEFTPVDDPALLAEAIGEPDQGKLCQGQVYQATADSQVTLFRAWNSTNPGSQLGQWWAFSVPAGKVATYRSDFEICYQWSPLDVMVRCTLKSGTRVVVGNGQSAQCSQYLTYPVSAAQQVYLDDASTSVENCSNFEGIFSWQPQ